MTEYEIADLAAAGASNAIGLTALIQNAIGSFGEAIQQFMTILFAYLAAAYLVGSKLETRQAWIFNTLYVFWQLWTISAVATRGAIVLMLRDRLLALVEINWKLAHTPDVLVVTSVVLLSAALAASLYFMWSVRNPKTVTTRAV